MKKFIEWFINYGFEILLISIFGIMMLLGIIGIISLFVLIKMIFLERRWKNDTKTNKTKNTIEVKT